VEQAKTNPRFRLTGEEEVGAMQYTEVLTRAVAIRGDKITGYTVPKYTRVMPDDVVSFTNTTSGKVSIQFPSDEIFAFDTIDLAPQGEPGAIRELKVQAGAPIGTHGYSVFCQEGRQFAVGNSMPIIIVNPKD
jgi:hypothetical protein